jgi:hypothetical protein
MMSLKELELFASAEFIALPAAECMLTCFRIYP